MNLFLLAASVAAASPVDVPTWDAGVSAVPLEEFCSSRAASLICGGRDASVDEGVVAVGDGDFGQVVLLATPGRSTALASRERRYEERVYGRFGRKELSEGEVLKDIFGATDTTETYPARIEHSINPMACGSPSTDEVSDGQGGCKLVFGSDSRNIVTAARSTYPHTKYAQVTMGRFEDNNVFEWTCSGFFVDDEFLVTAAHCVYDTDDNHWIYSDPNDDTNQPGTVTTPLGQDRGRGYVTVQPAPTCTPPRVPTSCRRPA